MLGTTKQATVTPRSQSQTMNLTQQVADTLGAAIISGQYDHTNPVPSEAAICAKLRVSRSAVREAVKSLAAKGLLASRARQGIRILPESEWNLYDADVLRWIRDANPSLDLIKEVTQLRIAVEPEAAYLAAQLRNRPAIKAIHQSLTRMKNAEEGLDDPVGSDIAFHRAILDASGNRFFMQLGKIIEATLRVSIRFTNRKSGVQVGAFLDHKRVYDEIEAGNPDAAYRNAKQLLDGTLATIMEAMPECPG